VREMLFVMLGKQYVVCGAIVVIYMDSTVYVLSTQLLLPLAVLMFVHCCQCKRTLCLMT